VQPLLDAVVQYLPPGRGAAPEGFHVKKEKTWLVPVRRDGPRWAGLQDPERSGSGPLSYVRMYSGELREGMAVYNVAKHKRERINRLLRMHSNRSESMDRVTAETWP